MSKQFKKIGLIILTLLTLVSLLPFGQEAEAYGIINYEQVTDVGKNHFVVLKDDGSVWTWGDNTYGQLGANGPSNLTNPTPVQLENGNRLLNIQSIAAGGDHTVALDNNGDVWTWGLNTHGQLGHSGGNLTNEKPQKVDIPNGQKVTAIAAGNHHTLAVDDNDQVWAWGKNYYGQIGTATHAGTWTTIDEPTVIPNFFDVVAVAAGGEHSVALKKDGTVWTWGRNSTGQLGNGETTDINNSPRIVSGLTDVMEISAGENHTLALKQDRTTVWAWGSNSYGQLGDGGREMKLRPVQVEGMRNVNQIAAGTNHSVVIREDGTVWTWGRHTSGTGSVRTTPIEVTGLTGALAIGGGGYGANSHILAVKDDGTVWSWDRNSSDTTTKLPVFKKVSGIDDVMKIDAFPFVQGGQVLFRYIGNNFTNDVKVHGSFNDWIELPLEQKSGNVWELQIDVGAGEYDYGFKVNGNWTVDPLNRNKTIDEFGRPLSVVNVIPYATESPIVDNKTVTFTYSSFDYNGTLELDAKTQSVAVKGSFNNWVEEPLIKQSNNTWALSKTMDPGDYYYSYVVRDVSTGPFTAERNDPLNQSVQTDSLTNITRNTFHISEQLLTRVPVTDIKLNKGPALDLIVGEQDFLLATISPSNATNKNIAWHSSNPSVASVNAGKITAHSKGSAYIYATSVENGEKTAGLTVTVEQQDGAVSYPKVGYKTFPEKTGVAPTKAWKIKFNKPLKLSSISNDRVYVLNESGIKVPIGYQLLDDDKILEIRLLDGFQYERGATYYLFVEDELETDLGRKLKEAIQMKFTIQL